MGKNERREGREMEKEKEEERERKKRIGKRQKSVVEIERVL